METSIIQEQSENDRLRTLLKVLFNNNYYFRKEQNKNKYFGVIEKI